MASGSAWWKRTTQAPRPVTSQASHIHGWLVAKLEVIHLAGYKRQWWELTYAPDVLSPGCEKVRVSGFRTAWHRHVSLSCCAISFRRAFVTLAYSIMD